MFFFPDHINTNTKQCTVLCGSFFFGNNSETFERLESEFFPNEIWSISRRGARLLEQYLRTWAKVGHLGYVKLSQIRFERFLHF